MSKSYTSPISKLDLWTLEQRKPLISSPFDASFALRSPSLRNPPIDPAFEYNAPKFCELGKSPIISQAYFEQHKDSPAIINTEDDISAYLNPTIIDDSLDNTSYALQIVSPKASVFRRNFLSNSAVNPSPLRNVTCANISTDSFISPSKSRSNSVLIPIDSSSPSRFESPSVRRQSCFSFSTINNKMFSRSPAKILDLASPVSTVSPCKNSKTCFPEKCSIISSPLKNQTPNNENFDDSLVSSAAKFGITVAKPFNFQTLSRTRVKPEINRKRISSSDEPEILKKTKILMAKRNQPLDKENTSRFKAQTVPLSSNIPFVPKKSTKQLTDPLDPVLATKVRAQERKLFDLQVQEQEQQRQLKIKEETMQKQIEWERKLKELRKSLVHKAVPVPVYDCISAKDLADQMSRKRQASMKPPTEPKSPMVLKRSRVYRARTVK